MSAATTAAPATGALPTPKFLGVLRAEIFKMSRQPVNWLMAAGVLAMVALPWVLLPTTPFIRNELQANPLIAQFVQMGRSLTILRVFGGLFVIVLTARVFGLDYQQGTIRIILARGVGRLQLLGAKLLTVHAGGGPAMLAAAQETAASVQGAPQLLAVTVLTSMDEMQLKAVGVKRSPGEQVEFLARMGIDCGIRGFVCSPREVAGLRALTGPEGTLVIPGIRPAGGAAGDQRRIATPADALRDGASYLVVGRPITPAADPAKAAEAILEEMAGAV